MTEKGVSLKAFELKIVGEVQQVGYRRRVWRIANKIGVKGYVKNIPDGNVKIFAEGEEQVLKTFVKSIDIKEPPILVEEIEAKERKPTGRYRYFKIRTGPLAEELQEGLGAGEAQLNVFRREFKDYREEFRDYRGEFRGFARRTDENFKSLEARYGDISEKLTEILQTLEKESMETRIELTRAVDNLTQLIQKFIQQSAE